MGRHFKSLTASVGKGVGRQKLILLVGCKWIKPLWRTVQYLVKETCDSGIPFLDIQNLMLHKTT